jgi:hypothetical protein
MEPKWLAFGDGALAVALVKALYDAKNDEQWHLRMAALLKTMEADRLVALAAIASGRPTHNWSNMNSENARTRRRRTRAAGRASAQAAKDSAAEAKARAEQEAAAGVAAGVEEALAEVRRKEEIKYEPAQDQADEESEDDDNAEEEVIKFAFGFPSPKRGRKPSGERQAETKRPRSPGRQDELQGEQHGAAATMEEYMAMLKEMDKKSTENTHRLMEMMDKGFHTQFAGAHQVSLPLGGVPDRAPK